jgi:hypothetical protein
MINTPKDVKDIHSKGNIIYTPTNARLDLEDFFAP